MRADEAIARARQARESSKLLLEAGDFVGAVNRGYYAMFYAAHAALAHSRIEVPSAKHGTLVSRFGEHLVITGRVPEHFGRWLNQALETRSIGDYGDVPPDYDKASELLARADALLAAIEALLAAPPIKPRGRRA